MTRGEFLQSMAQAATGVTVVTTDGAAGRWGQTVSSMCSVSAEPPTLLVCVHRKSPLVAAVEANGAFAVNVLAAGQEEVADAFAGRGPGAYDFAVARWERLATGAPALAGAAAAFDSRLADATDAGTHRVLFGTVVACRGGVDAADPLTYAHRRYGRHSPLVA